MGISNEEFASWMATVFYVGMVDWDFLPSEEQMLWVLLARDMDRTLNGMEGQSFTEVATAVAKLWSRSEEAAELDAASMIRWQAVCRFAATILDWDDDGDEGLDVGGSIALYVDLAQRHLASLLKESSV